MIINDGRSRLANQRVVTSTFQCRTIEILLPNHARLMLSNSLHRDLLRKRFSLFTSVFLTQAWRSTSNSVQTRHRSSIRFAIRRSAAPATTHITSHLFFPSAPNFPLLFPGPQCSAGESTARRDFPAWATGLNRSIGRPQHYMRTADSRDFETEHRSLTHPSFLLHVFSCCYCIHHWMNGMGG